MLPDIMNQSVSVVRPTASGEDAYGNPIPGTPTVTPVASCSLQPLIGASSVETIGLTYDQVVSRWVLYAPGTADIKSSDRIQQGRLDLQVDGDPSYWQAVNDLDAHIVCYLKRWSGSIN